MRSMLVAQRYQVVRELGSGAMGRVSLALDQQSNQLVALKQMHQAVAAMGGARMRREFRSLSQIESEFVVRVFDYGEDSGVPFIAMEFVRGRDLSEWLEDNASDGQPPVKPDVMAITRVFADIAAALGAVHAQGVIHRDLKPENIRVTPDDRAKLMDFGLAKTLEGSVALTRAGAMVGTALYMAPEQCRGAAIDYRADLYALGAVLYRALTGRSPFEGDSIVAVIMQHLQQAPQPPRSLNALIPESLERLCLALLAKNPAERPGSALAVREALLAILETPQSTLVEPPAAARADALLIAPLIGRDLELKLLEDFASLPSLSSGWIALTGDVGTGKTRLLKALSESVQVSGVRVALLEAIADDPTPLGAVSRFIAGLERHHRAVLDQLSASSKTELSRIAPTLEGAGLEGAWLSSPPPDSGLPPEVARLKLFEAFTELLTLVSRSSVAVFENLQWADESTLALLAHSLRSADVRVIASYRLEDLPTDQHVPKGFPKARQTVHLGGLPDSALKDLLDALLDGEIESALQTELLLHSGGNPWLLEERLKAMLESKAIQRHVGLWEWNRAQATLPGSLTGLLSHRVQQLPGATLEFARAASVLGRAFNFEDTRALLDWSDDAALAGLEGLLRARVVVESPASDGEVFRFTHPLYAELLLGGLMTLKRRKLHQRAATLLAGRAEPLELSEHWLAGEQWAQALESGLTAGQRAQGLAAYPQAERAYRIALEAATRLQALGTLSADQGLLGLQVRCALGEVLSFVGRNSEAQQLWVYTVQHALSLPGSEITAAKAKVNLVRAQRLSGALEAAQSLLGEPVAGQPLFAEICTELCALYAIKGDTVNARQYGLRALQDAKKAANLEGVVKALMGLGMTKQSDQRKVKLLRLGVRVAAQHGNNHLLARVWNDLGVALYHVDRSAAFQAWHTAAGFANTAGDIALLMRLEINSALISMQDMDFLEAQTLLQHALSLAERIGETTIARYSGFNLAQCKYAQGLHSEARALFKEVRDHPLSDDARLWETRMSLELGDGFVLGIPTAGDEGLRQLLEVQLALSYGDYAKAYALTAQPNITADWHWALARVHAGWRLGVDVQDALTTLLNLESLSDPNLTPKLMRRYAQFVLLIVSGHRDAASTERLRQNLEGLRMSAIGQLARDVAADLEQSA